jgi:hypothetical protein
VEVGQAATSRIIGATPVNRVADALRLPQAGNLEFRRGSITTIFALDHDGVPVQDVCLFDTRDPAGLNGLAAFYTTAGSFRFMIAGLTPKILNSTVYSLQAGIFHDLTVEWSGDLMRIRYNNDVVAEDLTSVTLPTQLNPWIYLFQTSAGTNRLDGELASFEIRRDILI